MQFLERSQGMVLMRLLLPISGLVITRQAEMDDACILPCQETMRKERGHRAFYSLSMLLTV